MRVFIFQCPSWVGITYSLKTSSVSIEMMWCTPFCFFYVDLSSYCAAFYFFVGDIGNSWSRIKSAFYPVILLCLICVGRGGLEFALSLWTSVVLYYWATYLLSSAPSSGGPRRLNRFILVAASILLCILLSNAPE